MKKGFTLIELLIVMVLMGLSVSIVLPNIGAGLDKMRFRGDVKRMAVLLQKIRYQALSYQKTIRLGVRDGRLTVEGLTLDETGIPAIEVGMPAEILFFANGVSSGGELNLFYKNRAAVRMIVERFSGRVVRQDL